MFSYSTHFFILPVPVLTFCDLGSVAGALAKKFVEYLSLLHVEGNQVSCFSFLFPKGPMFSLVFLLSLIYTEKLLLLLTSLGRFTISALAFLTWCLLRKLLCISPKPPVLAVTLCKVPVSVWVCLGVPSLLIQASWNFCLTSSLLGCWACRRWILEYLPAFLGPLRLYAMVLYQEDPWRGQSLLCGSPG